MTVELPYTVRTWCVLCGFIFRAENLPCPGTPHGHHLFHFHFEQLPQQERARILAAKEAGQQVTADPKYAHNATCFLCGVDLRRWFTDVRFATRIDNGLGVENDEQGQPIWICRGLRAPWPALWPQLKNFG